jgi:hypothetical protein
MKDPSLERSRTTAAVISLFLSIMSGAVAIPCDTLKSDSLPAA